MYDQSNTSPISFPANTKRWANVGLTLGQCLGHRLRRWPNIQTRFMFAELVSYNASQVHPSLSVDPSLIKWSYITLGQNHWLTQNVGKSDLVQSQQT